MPRRAYAGCDHVPGIPAALIMKFATRHVVETADNSMINGAKRGGGCGVLGTAVLAVAAWLAGALPYGDPGAGLRLHGLGATSGKFQLGLALWLAGSVVLAVVWWQARRGEHGVRWTVLAGSLWAAPLLFAPPLASRDVYAYACQGDLWLAGLDPYRLGVADGGCLWTPSVPELWWHTPTPYGPLAVIFSGAAVAIARVFSNDLDTQLAIAVTMLRLIALGGLALLAWGATRINRKSLWLGLVTPLVAVHAVSGAHNDALMAGLIVAGLAAAGERLREPPEVRSASRMRQDWLLAGVFLGGAVAVKVTALAAVPFALLLLPPWRSRWACAAAGAGTFAALTLASGLDLGWARALTRTGDLQQWTSLPTGAGMAVGYLLRALGHPGAMSASITVARALGLVALLIIAGYALRRAWNAPPTTVIAACGWVLAAVAVLGPVFYPWYAIAPLAVLACATESWSRTRAAVTIGLCFLVLPNGLGLAVLTKGPGAFLALAAAIGLAVWGLRAARARPTATA
jgi:alpha-1,6-mannosyltransferase